VCVCVCVCEYVCVKESYTKMTQSPAIHQQQQDQSNVAN